MIKKILLTVFALILVIVSMYYFFRDNTVIVIDLTGYETKEVKKYATKNSIAISIKKEYSSTVEKGKVIRQDKEAGIKIKQNEKMTVYISRGPN